MLNWQTPTSTGPFNRYLKHYFKCISIQSFVEHRISAYALHIERYSYLEDFSICSIRVIIQDIVRNMVFHLLYNEVKINMECWAVLHIISYYFTNIIILHVHYICYWYTHFILNCFLVLRAFGITRLILWFTAETIRTEEFYV